MGDGEKLLTHLNSALKVLLGLDIFPSVPKKKKLNFVDQCYRQRSQIFVSVESSRLTFGNTYPLIYCEGGALYPRVRRPLREIDHSSRLLPRLIMSGAVHPLPHMS